MARRRIRSRQRQSVRHDRHHRPLRAGRCRTGRPGQRCRPCRRAAVGRQHATTTRRCARQDRYRALGAARGTRPAVVARRRQDPAGRHRRGHPCGEYLQVLRRGGLAPARRQAGLGTAWRGNRSHARAGRGGRHHRAMELPDGDSRLEDRTSPGVRQHGRVQARGARAGLRLGAGGDHQPRGIAGGSIQPGDGARFASGPGHA